MHQPAIDNALTRLTRADGDAGLKRAESTDPSTILPAELLAQIFGYLCSVTVYESELEVMKVDAKRALSPFGVARVSRRWRSVALGSAGLWHYVAIHHFDVDKQPRAPENTLGYISLVLERSRDSPVDINIEYMSDDPPMAYLRILDALTPGAAPLAPLLRDPPGSGACEKGDRDAFGTDAAPAHAPDVGAAVPRGMDVPHVRQYNPDHRCAHTTARPPR